jgi:hypothetical protein
MKALVLLVLTLCTLPLFAQLKVSLINKKDIPSDIHFIGNLINAARYKDKEGKHIILTTETGETKAKGSDDGDDFRQADLYAYNYPINAGKQTLTWQMHDFVRDCPVDITANYIPKTFAVTDLDNNGVAEVWIMYRTMCRGDVSPANMKVIMYEGNKKYAIRGTARIKQSAKSYDGGGYTLDPEFKAGPDAFKQYALQLWKKNLTEGFN